jgi:hypothetical protein
MWGCSGTVVSLITYRFTSCSKIFDSYGDVTIAGEGLLMVGAQGLWAGGGGVFIVPDLLWHETLVFRSHPMNLRVYIIRCRYIYLILSEPYQHVFLRWEEGFFFTYCRLVQILHYCSLCFSKTFDLWVNSVNIQVLDHEKFANIHVLIIF